MHIGYKTFVLQTTDSMSTIQIQCKTAMQRHIHNLGEPGDKQAGILSKNTVLLGV